MTDEIKIEKAIPLPVKKTGWRKYPYPDMEVNDSFFLAPKGTTLNSLSTTISATSRAYGLKANCKFAHRTVTENGVTGVRVWRVE